MCGLFGFVLKASIPQEIRQRIVTLLAYEMDHRGGDSWGYWHDAAGEVKRGLGHATYKIGTAQFKKSKVLLAHTRFGTTGKVIIENAHPFEIGDIIGAHNGIVHNHMRLNNQFKRNFDVDSMHIFAHINEQRPLKEVDAYGAITFINKKDFTKKNAEHVPVYLGKFNHGSLCIAGFGKVEDPEGIVWCSDETDLKRILNYAEREFFTYKVENEALYQVDNYNLLRLGAKLSFGKETKGYGNQVCDMTRTFVHSQPSMPGRQNNFADHVDNGGAIWQDDEESCYVCNKPLFTPCAHCSACIGCCLCGITVRNLDESSKDSTKLLLLKEVNKTETQQVFDVVEINGDKDDDAPALQGIENTNDVLDYSAVIGRELNEQEKERFLQMKLD